MDKKEGMFLRVKALFMMTVLIAAIFSVYNIKLVSASDDTNVCCETTTDGESCIYTSEDTCASPSSPAASTCEQTSYCATGVCVSDQGQCSDGVARATCENNGYSWHEGTSAELSQCQKDCCVIAGGAQCAYTTETYCENLVQGLEGVSYEFTSAGSESECTNLCDVAEKGCCVSEDSCTYTTQGDCADPSVDISAGTGFYSGTYCSDLKLDCPCDAHSYKQCVGEDVYWFDSCGNQEEVVQAGDEDTEGNKASDSGNCDYLNEGTLCGYSEEDEDYVCRSVDCADTFNGEYFDENRDTHDRRIGGQRENGESWCLYESPAGGWFDRPGSQHYRSLCINGEEQLESCADQRSEVCLQYPYTIAFSSTILNETDEWDDTESGAYDLFPEAGSRCMDNGIYSDINGNVTTVPPGDSDSCDAGNLECQVVFGKTTATGIWRCLENCGCLTPGWAEGVASWCAVQGDCGAKYNLAGEYSDDGFYIQRDSEYAGGNQGENENIYVGFDEGCDYQDFVDGTCKSKGTCNEDPKPNERCEFIEDVTGDWVSKQKNNYGVYGGLLGFSQAMGDVLASDEDYGLVSDLAAGLIGTGAGIAVFVTLAESLAVSGSLLGSIFFPAVTYTLIIPGIGWIIAGAVLVVAVTAYILGGGETMTVTISSVCEPWVAPPGGDNCELCQIPVSEKGLAIDDGNGNILPGYECNEYKCSSLGSQCEFVGDGTSNPLCIAKAAGDTNSPYIQAYKVDVSSEMEAEGLADTEDYTEDDTPDYDFTPNGGLKILEPVLPYRPIEIGIQTDEPSQCRIQVDGEPPEGFGADAFNSLSNLFTPDFAYEHNMTWTLTAPSTAYTFYVRCWDMWDDTSNYNEKNFQIDLETSAGEDFMPPSIEATSVANGAFIAAGVTETAVSVFTNEVVNACKWSSIDQDYSLMENTMVCSAPPTGATSLFDYECDAALPVSEGTNSYYFACEDVVGNANVDNTLFTLIGTDPLLIDYAIPTGTIYTDYTELEVRTSEGAEDGNAVCSFNDVEFYQTGTSLHSQSLRDLSLGDYAYDILCTDVAGNTNSTIISFTADVDLTAPSLISVYKSGNKVYFSLDEETTCEYYFEDFAFGDGVAVENSFDLTGISTYDLKCQDVFGNEGSWTIQV